MEPGGSGKTRAGNEAQADMGMKPASSPSRPEVTSPTPLISEQTREETGMLSEPGMLGRKDVALPGEKCR